MRALLLGTTLSLALVLAAPAAAQGYGDMGAGLEQSMAAAQAQAVHPGDDDLTCEQLEEEIATTMQDPAVQSAIAANGADAQAQIDEMNASAGRRRAQMAASMFMGILSSFIPGMGYAQMAQQQMQMAEQQRQAQQSMAQMQVMMERMSGIMPQMMRGQRVYELGQAKQCEFTQQQQQQQ